MGEGKKEPCGHRLELNHHHGGHDSLGDREKLCAPAHTPAFPHCQQKGPEAEAPQEQ